MILLTMCLIAVSLLVWAAGVFNDDPDCGCGCEAADIYDSTPGPGRHHPDRTHYTIEGES